MNQVWDIIPKITSPLAVICFGLYVFYLIRRSEDKKKEQSLQVSDSAAQQNAADKILRDHPDIVIDTIRDPQGAVELARQVIDGKLQRHHKTANALLIFSAIFAATFLLSLLISNKDLMGNRKNESVPDKPHSPPGTWAQQEAHNKNYPYACLSIVQHIKLKDIQLAENVKKRIAEFRNYYTISATKDLTEADHVFEEQFITNNATINPWPGSETQQIESISDGRYWVKFNLKKEQPKTIVTGANYIYSVPLMNSTATSCFGNIITSPNEWMTCYPNSLDYIDQITILIEGEGIQINLPPIATYKKDSTGSIKEGEGSCKVYASNNNCTLIAKWDKISPGECVGFKINWSLP